MFKPTKTLFYTNVITLVPDV